MAIRTLTQIIDSAVTYLAAKRADIATFVGTVTRDVVIESPAQEFANLYTELSHTQQIQSIQNAGNLSSDELDALAVNFGMTRNPGTQAAGSVTFQLRNFNTSSSPVTVPIGTSISTLGSSSLPQVSFITTQSIIFTPSFAPTYFNPATGFYEQTASIIAQSIGIAGNVAAGTITQLVTNVPGVDRVANYISTTGGTDIESNALFAGRIQKKLSGNNIGSPNGIISLMKQNPSVVDAIIVGPNDTEMERSQFGGEVDVYILGQILASATDIDTYFTAGSQSFILQHQPAKTITNITGLVLGSPHTFVQGVDYSLSVDPDILVAGSTKMKTAVLFNIGGTNPDDSTNMTINYTYDQLIETLQLALDQDDTHIATADLLVKEAIVASIAVQCDVSLFSGVLTSDAISAVQTQLTNYINALGLGNSIDRSDIVSQIESVSSIDSVDLSTLILEKNAVPLPTSTQRLQIFKTEYPRTATITVNVIS